MASLWESRYSTNHEVILTNRFLSRFPENYKEGEIFTKEDPKIPDYEIIVGSGNLEFYVKCSRKKVFKISGSSGIGGIFNHYSGNSNKRQLPKGISNTDFLETFALLSLLGFINLKDCLNSDIVWDSELMIDPGEFEDTNEYTKSEIDTIFGNTKSLGNPKDFIHKSMDIYYDKLSKYENVPTLKLNTSDIVLIYSNHTKEDLFKALDNHDYRVEYDSCGLIRLFNIKEVIKFAQVSLKLSKNGARLGRVTTIFRNLTNLEYITPTDPRTTPEKLITRIHDKIETLSDIVNTKTDSKKHISLYTETAHINPDTNDTKYNLLMCNNISLECLMRLVPIIKAQGASNFVANIIDIMRRGSTNLPVIVNYSSGSDSEVLDAVEPINPGDLRPIIITIHNTDDSHYVINMYCLINYETKEYVKIQMTNAGGSRSVSWKVEGNTLITYENLKGLLSGQRCI